VRPEQYPETQDEPSVFAFSICRSRAAIRSTVASMESFRFRTWNLAVPSDAFTAWSRSYRTPLNWRAVNPNLRSASFLTAATSWPSTWICLKLQWRAAAIVSPYGCRTALARSSSMTVQKVRLMLRVPSGRVAPCSWPTGDRRAERRNRSSGRSCPEQGRPRPRLRR